MECVGISLRKPLENIKVKAVHFPAENTPHNRYSLAEPMFRYYLQLATMAILKAASTSGICCNSPMSDPGSQLRSGDA